MKTFQLVNRCVLTCGKGTKPRPTYSNSIRMLSTSATNAIRKLQSAINQYRLQNYSEELPSRCKKDFVNAADYYQNGNITVKGLSRTLKNIGATNEISSEEIETIVQELGSPSPIEQTISVKKMLQIL